MARPKKYKYAIHLAKPEVQEYSDFLTDTARAKIDSDDACYGGETDAIGDHAVVYTFAGPPIPPRWLKQVKQCFPDVRDFTTSSVSALILFKKSGRIFAATFGFAHSLIDSAKRENEFGLRVAINRIKDSDVRTIEKSNLGSAVRDLAQAARRSNLDMFKIDDALEVIRQISGDVSEDGSSIDSVSGASVMKVTSEATLDEIGGVAEEALKLFTSKEYQKSQFKIIDMLRQERDTTVQQELFQAAVESLKAKEDRFELALPEILTDERIGFVKFSGARIKGEFPDVSLRDYLDGLAGGLDKLSIDDLWKHRLVVYDSATFDELRSWPIAQALIGSTSHGGETYVANEGSWYQVASGVVSSAEQAFTDALISLDDRLDKIRLVDRSKDGSKHTTYETEGEYNQRVAEEFGFLCMDRELLADPLGRKLGVELCDLFDPDKKRLILVKRSSRRSSTLSHFFRQGVTAARLFYVDEKFRREAFDRFVDISGGAFKDDTFVKSPKDFRFEFRIVDHPRPNGEFRIPFFSRLSLRDEFQILKGMGFQAKLGFVPQE